MELVLAIQHRDLEAEIVVRREERNSFGQDAQLRDREVAAPIEQVVVQHPCPRELPLVHGKPRQQQTAHNQWREDLCAFPRVDGYRGCEAETEEDQTGNEEEVTHPIQLGELFFGGVFLLQLPCGRMVQNEDHERREPVRPRRDVPEGPESPRVVQRESAADQQAQDPAHRRGRVGACLCDRPISSRQDLTRDRVNHGLRTLAER